MQQGQEERKRETREREVENKKNAVGVTTNRLTKRKFGCNKITYNNTLKQIIFCTPIKEKRCLQLGRQGLTRDENGKYEEVLKK